LFHEVIILVPKKMPGGSRPGCLKARMLGGQDAWRPGCLEARMLGGQDAWRLEARMLES